MPFVNRAGAPLVSVVIPSFEGEAFVAAAVESVLAQTHPAVECHVVDDGSSDGTLTVLRRFAPAVKVVEQANAGPGAARNRGAELAGGDLLAFLDQDDVWRPERLAKMVEAMDQESADAVICASRIVGDDAPFAPVVRMDPRSPSVESLLRWRGSVVACGSNLLIERDRFASLGGFDASLGPMTDWEFLVRLRAAEVRLAVIDEPLVEYRWHEANATRDLDAVEESLKRAYELILDRCGDALSISTRQAYGGMHKMHAVAALRLGDHSRAVRHGARATWLDPSLGAVQRPPGSGAETATELGRVIQSRSASGRRFGTGRRDRACKARRASRGLPLRRAAVSVEARAPRANVPRGAGARRRSA